MKIQTLDQILRNGTFELEQHGLKVQGLLELMRLREELGLDYEVPAGFVVPVSGATPVEIKGAFYNLNTDNDLSVILARSSSPSEEPGKFETIPVLYNPLDKVGSFLRFLSAYRAVVGTVPKAVIGQNMVGGISVFRDEDGTSREILAASTDDPSIQKQLRVMMDEGRVEYDMHLAQRKTSSWCGEDVSGVIDSKNPNKSIEDFYANVKLLAGRFPDFNFDSICVRANYVEKQLFGYDQVSFITQSHSSVNPAQMQIASVKGLGTKVVDLNDQAIIMDIDRETGKIVYIISSSNESYHSRWHRHRQNSFDFFDLKKGRIETMYVGESFEMLGESYQIDGEEGEYRDHYFTPFEDKGHVTNLVSVIKRLSEAKGVSIELEGAIRNGKLNLYQMRNLERALTLDFELTPVPNPILTSEHLIGAGIATMDLVWFYPSPVTGGAVLDIIGRLNRQFKSEGKVYATLTAGYSRTTTDATDNATIRLSVEYENLMAHVAGMTRLRALKGEKAMLLSNCSVDFDKLEQIPHETVFNVPEGNTFSSGYVGIFRDIRIESNGKRAQAFKP